MGGANDTRTLAPTSTPNLHNFVCRWQPAWAIAIMAPTCCSFVGGFKWILGP